MFIKREYQHDLDNSYQLVYEQLKALIEGENDLIANLANASALLNQFLTDINWVGFYLLKDNELVLGPFQGLPACIRIPLNKGVCGHAVTTNNTVIVQNVHEFADHIACDANSQSEIVVPLLNKKGEIIGVLDIDSPIIGRFTEKEKVYLERFVQILNNHF